LTHTVHVPVLELTSFELMLQQHSSQWEICVLRC